SPRGMRSGSRITAAATTGPASGPRPASSQPATGKTPRFIAARSRRKLGRSGASPSGRRGDFAAAGFFGGRLIGGDGARRDEAMQWQTVSASRRTEIARTDQKTFRAALSRLASIAAISLQGGSETPQIIGFSPVGFVSPFRQNVRQHQKRLS